MKSLHKTCPKLHRRNIAYRILSIKLQVRLSQIQQGVYVQRGRNGSIMMIMLWLLALLVIFAVSLGHRGLINLKLTRYQRDGLKAYYLAESGIKKSIALLDGDENKNYDSFDEPWSSGRDIQDKPILNNIRIKDNYAGSFSVKYLYDKKNSDYRCISDEERRINLNGIDSEEKREILSELFKFAEVNNPEELKRIIVDWIDPNPQSLPGEEIFKNQPLKLPEELLLILEYYYERNAGDKIYACKKAQEVYSKIKDLITVYPEDGKIRININTASRDVLMILANSIAQDEQLKYVDTIIGAIIEKRPFEKMESAITDVDAFSSDDDNLANNLKKYLDVCSHYFKIESTGNIGNVSKKIAVIYNRDAKEIVYRH